MKEELQIIAGAELADHDAPERLSKERAASFVDSVLKEKSKHDIRDRKKSGFGSPVWRWSAFVVGFAAAAILAVVLMVPSDHISSGYGEPAQMMEMESSHAGMEVLDSLKKSCPDTLVDTRLPVMNDRK